MTERDLVPTGTAAKAVGVSGALLRQGAREGWLTPAGTTPRGHYRWIIADLREEIRARQDRRGQS